MGRVRVRYRRYSESSGLIAPVGSSPTWGTERTAIRIKADPRVIQVSHLAKRNLGRAIGRILCPAPVTVIRHQPFGKAVRHDGSSPESQKNQAPE